MATLAQDQTGTQAMAERLGGWVQNTLWGGMWSVDLRVGEDVTDTAYSGEELAPHNDGCYMLVWARVTYVHACLLCISEG